MHTGSYVRTHGHKILVIADDEGAGKDITKLLSSERFALSLALSPNDGRRSYLEIKPDFVVLYLASSSPESLSPLTEICEADPQARVIVVSTRKDNTFVLDCIRRGAIDYLISPLKPLDLQHSIDRILSRSRLLRKAVEPDRNCVQEERKTLKFGNDIDNLPYIINQAVTNASVVCPDVPMLKTALGEVLLNAIEHGNLNIGMKEKSKAMGNDSYPELLKARMHDPLYSGRLVTLHVHMTHDKVTYRVIDEGEGFDHASLFKRELHATVGSGLGLFVAKSFFTRLYFRGRGNEVVLVYKRPNGLNRGE